MITYVETRVGLIAEEGPAKNKWTFSVKAWTSKRDASFGPFYDWSGVADTEDQAIKGRERLEKEARNEELLLHVKRSVL